MESLGQVVLAVYLAIILIVLFFAKKNVKVDTLRVSENTIKQLIEKKKRRKKK